MVTFLREGHCSFDVNDVLATLIFAVLSSALYARLVVRAARPAREP